MSNETDLFISPPFKIGKHLWRILVVEKDGLVGNSPDEWKPGRVRVTRYEWKRSESKLGKFSSIVIPEEAHWRSYKEWKTYDFNDGNYGGLPKTLRKLYDAHEVIIKGFGEEK